MDRPSRRTYQDKLRDPRWQKKRLEIFQRDGWECQHCGSAEDELQVHHRAYLPYGDPWDAYDFMLQTLCGSCHQRETEENAEAERHLIWALRAIGIPSEGFRILADHLMSYFKAAPWAKAEGLYYAWGLIALLPKDRRDIWPYMTNAMADMPEDMRMEFRRMMEPYRESLERMTQQPTPNEEG